MKQLTDIIAEVQAVDTTQLEAVQAALAQVVVDLQALAAGVPTADPIVTLTGTTQSGATVEFVPKQ